MKKKETAIARQKLYPRTKKRLKVRAAKESKNVPELIDELSLLPLSMTSKFGDGKVTKHI